MAVSTAVASIANLALEADKNSQMVDTKQIVTHALNANYFVRLCTSKTK